MKIIKLIISFLIVITPHLVVSMENKTQSDTTFTFKSLAPQDLPTLLSWFKEAHVAQWWPTPEADEFFEFFLQRIRSKDTFAFIVHLNGQPFGYIQYYRIDRTVEKAGSWLPQDIPEATTVGIDQFIGNKDMIGKGYGTQFIKEFITYLHSHIPELTTVIVDPEPDNTAAIKCYEKVGFIKVGTFETNHGHALLMRYDIK